MSTIAMPQASAPASNGTGRAKFALQAFFMADTQAGIGPCFGDFLHRKGGTSGSIGTVMVVHGRVPGWRFKEFEGAGPGHGIDGTPSGSDKHKNGWHP